MNPILPLEHFVPDAEPRVWSDGRVYVYGSYDLSGDVAFCSNEYRVFSSADLVNWTDYGAAFTATNSYWRSSNYWDVSDWNELLFRLKAQ